MKDYFSFSDIVAVVTKKNNKRGGEISKFIDETRL